MNNERNQLMSHINLKIYEKDFDELRQRGVQSPEKDFVLFIQNLSLKSDGINGFEDQIDFFFAQRKKRIPVERMINQAQFRNLWFKLNRHVFKPCFETETLIDYALGYLEDVKSPSILDCGAGSGCILLSLLNERLDATGIGIDIEDNIINLAKDNAKELGLNDRCRFRVSDWGAGIDDKFDLIISNPPRIPTNYIQDLVKEVSLYDPKTALDGGKMGVEFYKRTAKLMRTNGKVDAVCILQVGDIILLEAIKAIKDEGFGNITIGRDYKYTTNCLIFSNMTA